MFDVNQKMTVVKPRLQSIENACLPVVLVLCNVAVVDGDSLGVKR